MPVIDRYIYKELITIYIVTLLSAIAIYVGIDLISNLAQSHLPASAVLKLYRYKIPTILTQMMAVSMFLSVLICYSDFANHLELVAMSASGISTQRIFAPALSFAIFLAILHLVISDVYVTRAGLEQQQRTNEITGTADTNISAFGLKESNLWFRSQNRFFNFLSVNSNGREAQGVTIYFMDESFHLARQLTSKSVQFLADRWVFSGVREVQFNGEGGSPVISLYETKDFDFGIRNEEIREVIPRPAWMRLAELKHSMARNRRAGVDSTALEIEFYSRIGFSFACVIFTLISFPFCTKSKRLHSFARNLGICFLCVVVYWVLFNFFISIGRNGILPSIVAGWGANILFLGVCVVIYRRYGAIR